MLLGTFFKEQFKIKIWLYTQLCTDLVTNHEAQKTTTIQTQQER